MCNIVQQEHVYFIKSGLFSARLALPLNPTHDEFHFAASCGSQAMPHESTWYFPILRHDMQCLTPKGDVFLRAEWPWATAGSTGGFWGVDSPADRTP